MADALPGCGGHALHGARGPPTFDGIDIHLSALRLHRRGRLRDLGRRRRGRGDLATRCSPIRGSSRSASAPAIRCASRPGSASTATTSTRRPRRSRLASPGRSRSAGARRAAFPAPSASSARLADGPGAPARRPAAGGPRAGARGRGDRRPQTGETIGTVTSGGFGPSVGGPSPWAMCRRPFRRAGHRPLRRAARQGRAGQVAPLPFAPHRYKR